MLAKIFFWGGVTLGGEVAHGVEGEGFTNHNKKGSIMDISFIILGADSKLALAPGEELVAVENSPFTPKGEKDPFVGFVTENSNGRVLGFWTNAEQCRNHPGMRIMNLEFRSVSEASEFLKTQCPGQYSGSFSFKVS